MWRHLLMEFYGTIMFGYFQVASFGDANTTMLGLWSCILGTGIISGAHFNPVVTFSGLIKQSFYGGIKKKKILKAFAYLLFQLLGYILGALIGYGVTGSAFRVKSGDSNMVSAYAAEMVFACQLVLVVILIEVQKSLLLGTLAVSIVIFLGIVTVGPVSGACFNPAFCIGTNFVYALLENDFGALEETHLYLFGPFIGGFIGAFYAVILLKRPLYTKEDELCIYADDKCVSMNPELKNYLETYRSCQDRENEEAKDLNL